MCVEVRLKSYFFVSLGEFYEEKESWLLESVSVLALSIKSVSSLGRTKSLLNFFFFKVNSFLEILLPKEPACLL